MILIFDEARSPNIYYRAGFNSDAECLYVEDGDEKTLYVPGFEYMRAREEAQGVAVEKLGDVEELLESFEGPFTVPGRFPYALTEFLDGEVGAERELFSERKTKGEDEITHLEDAQRIARKAVRLVQRHLAEATVEHGVAVRDGKALTSEGLKTLVRTQLISKGYDCPDLIISSGSQTAKPHHRGAGPIHEGPVIIDVFPQSELSRYHGDATRTVIVGEDARAEEMLSAVKEAHDACVAMCTPGTKAAAVHEKAREVLAEAGFASEEEQGLIHSVGHGLGLAVHEVPSVSPSSEDVLEEGMVVTIEPGLYYDVGVRYENAVLVGEEPRVLGQE